MANFMFTFYVLFMIAQDKIRYNETFMTWYKVVTACLPALARSENRANQNEHLPCYIRI